MKLVHLLLFSCLIGNALAMHEGNQKQINLLQMGIREKDGITGIYDVSVRIDDYLNYGDSTKEFNSFAFVQVDASKLIKGPIAGILEAKKENAENRIVTIRHSLHTGAHSLVDGLRSITYDDNMLDIREFEKKVGQGWFQAGSEKGFNTGLEEGKKSGYQTGYHKGKWSNRLIGFGACTALIGLAWYKKLISFHFPHKAS